MIVKVHKTAGSFRPAYEYNAKKYFAGEASLVATGNMQFESITRAYACFEELENNPQVSARTRNTCLHLSINPGPEDAASEDDIKAFVKDMLSELGYGEQPWILVRHEDIERRH